MRVVDASFECSMAAVVAPAAVMVSVSAGGQKLKVDLWRCRCTCSGLRLLLKVDDDDECDDAVIEGTCEAESSIDVSFAMGGDVVLVGGRAGGIEATVHVLWVCPGLHLFAAELKVEDDHDAIEGRQDIEPLLDVAFVAIFDADRGRSSGDSSPGPVEPCRPPLDGLQFALAIHNRKVSTVCINCNSHLRHSQIVSIAIDFTLQLRSYCNHCPQAPTPASHRAASRQGRRAPDPLPRQKLR